MRGARDVLHEPVAMLAEVVGRERRDDRVRIPAEHAERGEEHFRGGPP